MNIVKYKILNPVIDRNKPYYDYKINKLIIPIKQPYNYFIEAAQYNPEKGFNDYFLLLGKTKFDTNCRKCETNMYGKCKINITGEIKDYVLNQIKEKGNIDIEYIESGDYYDVFYIY